MDAILDLFRVTYEPTAVFERERDDPKFLAPFLTLAALTVVIQLLMLPYAKAAMAPVYAQMAQQNPQAAATAEKFAIVGVFFWPIGLAIYLLLWTGLLWLVTSLVGGEAKFRTLLSVALYSSITFIISLVVVWIIIMMKGKEALASPDDLQPAIGLDLLIPTTSRLATAFLKGINPFSIWGVALVAIGVSVTQKVSKGSGYTVAVVAFLVILLVSAGFAAACAPRTQ